MVLNMSMKLPEPKPFTGQRKVARAWITQLTRYFTATGLDAQVAAQSARMCNIALALM